MPVGTYYADTIKDPPRVLHDGLIAVTGVASTGATASTIGDIMVLAKAPHGAIIIDAIVQHNSPASVGNTYDFGMAYPTVLDSNGRPATLTGTGSSASAVATAVGQNTMTRWTKAIPNNTGHAASNFVVSASDSAADNLRYACLIATCQGTTPTTSCQVVGTLVYYMPPK